MKKLIGFISFCFIIVFIVYFIFSMPSCQQKISHYKSSIIGLKRTIVLYSNDGEVLREWDTNTNVEDRNGIFRFLTKEGKVVQISGTVVVEEN